MSELTQNVTRDIISVLKTMHGISVRDFDDAISWAGLWDNEKDWWTLKAWDSGALKAIHNGEVVNPQSTVPYTIWFDRDRAVAFFGKVIIQYKN